MEIVGCLFSRIIEILRMVFVHMEILFCNFGDIIIHFCMNYGQMYLMIGPQIVVQWKWYYTHIFLLPIVQRNLLCNWKYWLNTSGLLDIPTCDTLQNIFLHTLKHDLSLFRQCSVLFSPHKIISYNPLSYRD